MKIGILSLDAGLYSTRRIQETARDRGHWCRVLNYLNCSIDIATGRPHVLMSGKKLLKYDAIVPRIGASNTFYGTAVVRQFEMMKVFTACASDAISRSRDKLRCMQLLAAAGVALPLTGCSHSTQHTEELIAAAKGAPVVVKTLTGTHGLGVVLAETEKVAEAIIGAFRGLKADVMVQEYIAEAKGTDIRCFVVGGRVVASMLRQGPDGEFRSNLHRGGRAKKVKITPAERALAVRAAKVMGLGIAGVDMLRSNHGPLIMEVNSSPGLEGIEDTTGVDVAGKIVDYLEKSVGKRERARKI
jgi:ribosomal protein S6--L-glutamate ligase